MKAFESRVEGRDEIKVSLAASLTGRRLEGDIVQNRFGGVYQVEFITPCMTGVEAHFSKKSGRFTSLKIEQRVETKNGIRVEEVVSKKWEGDGPTKFNLFRRAVQANKKAKSFSLPIKKVVEKLSDPTTVFAVLKTKHREG